MKDDSSFISKGPCPACGSRDNLARYSDGHAYCFGCQHYEPGDGSEHQPQNGRRKMAEGLIEGGEFKALVKRGITEETCRKFGYKVADFKDSKVQIAPYYDASGTLVGQKVRWPNKDFKVFGGIKEAGLFGQQLWGTGGKMLVITEGEIDTLTVSQLQGNKWPVVSVPNGAQGAAKAIARNLEWVESFGKVIFMFDMDEPGRDATAECVQLLSPGKAFSASLPLKDPNECLMGGKGQDVVSAIWNAKPYRPDGIRMLSDLREEAKKPIEIGLPWCLPTMTKWTYGRREGEVYTFGAGTGVGKTDLFTQQCTFDTTELDEPIGVFFLEQQNVETARRLAGKLKGKRFHIPDGSWTQEELAEAVDEMADANKVYLYNHFGQTDWDVIRSRIRFMRQQAGVRLFYIDNLTSLADPSNERESLETAMAELSGIAQELKLIIHLISHLSTPSHGKPHEAGGRVELMHFKGARAIGFWTHFAFGLERDKGAEDPAMRNVTTVRCVKDRYTGQADGEVFYIRYDRDTCRLEECIPDFGNEAGPDDFDSAINRDF